MDGTELGVFISGASVQLPNSLAIDFNTDELCWADAGTKTIGKNKKKCFFKSLKLFLMTFNISSSFLC